ncbi:hypothetical protein BRUCa_0706 [Brucella melitensis]|nr:hypothetical protein BM28_A0714 [Brucella melitensis M28]AEW18142.1 hypothetical protein BAA13334_I02838 [Brucella abortus A13334]AIB17442.1 Hypothetical protein BSSP3_I0712 [Brucella suis bv. 2]AIB21103.1 Hypothetical protein BSPT1_I1014 [Brucella suis bv. 2]AIB24460.1 Hypothetical protein BSPT2_I1001 [Brucella suis bv. 2]
MHVFILSRVFPKTDGRHCSGSSFFQPGAAVKPDLSRRVSIGG